MLARAATPRGGKLVVQGTMPDATFDGMDPRHQDVRLQMWDDSDQLVCCTIPSQYWMRLFGRTFGFWDELLRVCPPIKDVTLSLPRKGKDRIKIIAAGPATQSFVGEPLDVAVAMGGQCTSGGLTLRRRSATRAVFP